MSAYVKRIIIDICLIAAFGLGVIFFSEVFIDFLISLFHFQGKLNFSSGAYCIHRILFVFFPLALFTTKTFIPKVTLLKFILYTIGITYFVGNCWVILFSFKHSIVNLFDASIPVWFVNGVNREIVNEATNVAYLFQYNDAYIFNYLTWDTYDLFGVLFSTIQGLMYIYLARNIDGDEKKVLRIYFVICLLNIGLPILYALLVKGRFFTQGWGERNIFLLFEGLITLIALKIASTSKVLWNDIIFNYH